MCAYVGTQPYSHFMLDGWKNSKRANGFFVSCCASGPSSLFLPLEQADGHSTKPVQHQSERRAGAP